MIDDRALEEVVYSPVCGRCANLLDGTAHKCKAFEKIPGDVWSGKRPHTSSIAGDHGIIFVRRR